MKYIVYLTHGEYSDFGLDKVKDPETILNELVEGVSEGRWKTFANLQSDAPYLSPMRKMDNNLIRIIRDKAEQELRENGFVEHEAKEVWLG